MDWFKPIPDQFHAWQHTMDWFKLVPDQFRMEEMVWTSPNQFHAWQHAHSGLVQIGPRPVKHRRDGLNQSKPVLHLKTDTMDWLRLVSDQLNITREEVWTGSRPVSRRRGGMGWSRLVHSHPLQQMEP